MRGQQPPGLPSPSFENVEDLIRDLDQFWPDDGLRIALHVSCRASRGYSGRGVSGVSPGVWNARLGSRGPRLKGADR